ncbi:predicted protein [Nematostella vectensis]|uniref:G-protein coupled receptors family 1 profile domain-containing protein n=1 Tax=Nematostella vectensis TaxID=45351 RepID=A7SHN3_NEMVE|nr:predicted protein [Nematostella vectensis]|eukprot:XP_001628799.1 predicted protein [Nematostella vectensis]
MVIKTHNKALSGWGARRIDPKVGRVEHWADHKARPGPGTHARGISVQEINITRTLFSIVVAFLVCWTPAFVIDIIDVYQLRWSLGRRAYVSYTFLVATSSTVNPILYGIMNPAFRKEYLKCLVYLRIQNNSVVTTNTSPSNRDSKI